MEKAWICSPASSELLFLRPKIIFRNLKMKHILSALALVALFAITANAQKQSGGEHNIELQFTPLGDSPVDGTTIKYRNFTDEESAFRLSLTLNSTNSKSIGFREFDFNGVGRPEPYFSIMPDGTIIEGGIPAIAGAYVTSGDDEIPSPDLYDTFSQSTWMVAPGYEKHFDAGGDKLSPYIGFEIGYGVTSSSFEQEFWSADDENQVGDQDQYIVWTQTISQSASMFKLGLVTGFDAYLTDYLYVGAEAGLGFMSSKVNDMEIAATDNVAYNLFWGTQNAVDPSDLTEMPAPIQGSVDLVGHAYSGQHPANINDRPFWTGTQQGGALGTQFQAQLRLGYLFQ